MRAEQQQGNEYQLFLFDEEAEPLCHGSDGIQAEEFEELQVLTASDQTRALTDNLIARYAELQHH